MRRNNLLNFAWLAVWGFEPRLVRSQILILRLFGALVRPQRLKVGCEPCPVFASFYPLVFSLQLMKNHGKTSVRTPERCSASLCPARSLWLTWSPSSNGLDPPAGPRHPWFARLAYGPTLGQRRYLPSCHNRGSPRQVSLSRNSRSEL
jgi:hypothetical protein